MFSLPLIYTSLLFFFFNDTATTEIYTLSLHDALPIYRGVVVESIGICSAGSAQALEQARAVHCEGVAAAGAHDSGDMVDRKSTRLNSSHVSISYAVFCLKKKKNI